LASRHDIAFSAGMSERMRILANGDVGIGVAAPTSKLHIAGSSPVILNVAGQSEQAYLEMWGDEGDDAGDKGRISVAHNANGMHFAIYGAAWDDEARIAADACYTEQNWVTQAVDYSEFFEWQICLKDEAEVEVLYGMTVVLEGNKVRLAKVGEETDVIGVVRPSYTSAFVGGDGIYWNKRKLRNVWGEKVKEPYTQLNWHILNEDGDSIKHYSYMKDKVPQYEVKEGGGLKNDIPNWHLLEENFKKDEDGNFIPLKVPTTNEEKEAHRYTERTRHRQTGKILMRDVYNPDFDPNNEFINRGDRRTEWCIVGLLGQIPVRATAVIPDHWVKMKNLEEGIDIWFVK